MQHDIKLSFRTTIYRRGSITGELMDGDVHACWKCIQALVPTVRRVASGKRGICRFALALTLLWSQTIQAHTVPTPLPLQEPWRWAKFTTESGLPSDKVHDLVETSDGILWAITLTGLAYYDGFRWHPLGRAKGVPNFKKISAKANPDGGLYLQIRGQVFVGDMKGFQQCPLSYKDEDLEPDQIFPLKQRSFIFTVAKQRIFLYRQGEITQLPDPGDGLIDGGLAWKGRVWVFTSDAVSEWIRDQWVHRFARQGLSGTRAAARADSFVIVEFGLGIRVFSETGPPLHRRTSDKIVRALDISPSGDIVVAYSSGVVEVYTAGQWRTLANTPLEMTGVRFVRFTTDGNLWVGGLEGLYVNRYACERWSRWEGIHGGEQNVNAIVLRSDGIVWIGTGDGIVIRHTDGHMQRIKSVLGTSLGAITGLAEDDEGGIWISSGGNFPGAFRYHEDRWQHVGTSDGLMASRIHKIVADRIGRLWFLGLAKLYKGSPDDPNPGAFVYDGEDFSNWGIEQGLIHGRVYDFAQGTDGSLWFATAGGISRWRDGQWKHWTKRDGLLAKNVFALATTPDRLWFGHANSHPGIGYIDDDDQPRYIEAIDAHTNGFVWDLRVAPDGAVWFSTQSVGIGSIRNDVVSFFGPSEGLVHASVWPIFPVEDRVYVGTLGGGVYELSLSESENPSPQVYIADPAIDRNRVTLRWQAFGYEAESPLEHVQTRYRLDDDVWSAWSTRREVGLLTASPGSHWLTVEAKSLFGKVSEPTRTSFQIASPFYQHPLFLGGAVFWMVTMIGGGIVYWRKQIASYRQNLKLQYQLLRAQKLEAIGTLSSGAAHDFNNSLTAITGFAECLKQRAATDTAEKELLQHILDACSQAANTTRGLLTFAGEANTERVVADIVQLIRQTVEILRRMLPKAIEIVVTVPKNVHAFCNMDKNQIQHVLMNLVINARDSIPDVGTITISVTNECSQPNFLCLQVTDTGRGMDASVRQRIFEPFFTTKRRGHGTGLGMAMVLGVIREHGGTISVDSKVDEGTTVRIQLPTCRPKSSDPKTEVKPRVDGRGQLVLLAEDDANVRKAVSTQLEKANFAVIAVSDGQAAIDEFTERANSIRLVILDIDLPRVSGWKCLENIRERAPIVPCILMSGLPFSNSEQMKVPFLRKPFNESELLSKVASIAPSQTGPRAGMLVIDDESQVRESVTALVRSHGIEVFEADCGTAAVERLKEHHCRIGTIFMDWNLPQDDPYVLARDLKQVSPEAKVFVVTGEIRRFDIPKEVEGIVEKPFGFEDTLKKIVNDLRIG